MSERQQVSGEVFKIYQKRFGNDETYTIKLDGNRTWFRAGKERYAGIAEAGNRITFEAEPLPDGESARVVRGSVKLAAPAAPAGASGTPSLGGAGRYGEGVQNSIVYQSSLKAALELVGILVSSGSLKLPAKVAARTGAIEAAVDRYTALFFNDVNTLGAVTREAEGDSSGAEDGESDDEGEETEE